MNKHSKRPQADVRKLVVASASSPINLGVLGAGTLGTLGLTLAGMPGIGVAVLAIGALAYGALIGLDVSNPAFIRKVYELPALNAPAALPATSAIHPDEIEPHELRRQYRTILAKFEELRQSVDATGEMIRDSLMGTLERSGELVVEAGRTAHRGNGLFRYLQRERPAAIQTDIDALHAQAKATRDEKAAKTFGQAAQAKEQQLETYRQIEGLYDRVKAQLSVIDTTLDGMQAKVVKLTATDVEEAAQLSASLSERIDALSSDMHLLESSVNETLQEIEP